MTEVAADLGVSNRLRILVVEDEPLIAMMIEEMLQQLDSHCVGPIRDRAVGLEYARTGQMDAAILNLVLGGENAYDIAEALAARGIPFGIASGVHRAGLPAKWLDKPYLEKPFTLSDLSRLLSQLLAQASEAVLNQPVGTSTASVQVPAQ